MTRKRIRIGDRLCGPRLLLVGFGDEKEMIIDYTSLSLSLLPLPKWNLVKTLVLSTLVKVQARNFNQEIYLYSPETYEEGKLRHGRRI